MGPLVWNVMYDNFLHLNLPAETSIFGFVEDALVVCVAEDLIILKLRINESLWHVKRWLGSRSLKMAPKETVALLFTDRRFFQYPEKTVLSTESFCAENNLSLQNGVDEFYVGPGARSANALVGEGKARDLSALQEAYRYKQPTGNPSCEGSHPQRWKAQTRREMTDEIA